MAYTSVNTRRLLKSRIRDVDDIVWTNITSSIPTSTLNYRAPAFYAVNGLFFMENPERFAAAPYRSQDGVNWQAPTSNDFVHPGNYIPAKYDLGATGATGATGPLGTSKGPYAIDTAPAVGATGATGYRAYIPATASKLAELSGWYQQYPNYAWDGTEYISLQCNGTVSDNALYPTYLCCNRSTDGANWITDVYLPYTLFVTYFRYYPFVRGNIPPGGLKEINSSGQPYLGVTMLGIASGTITPQGGVPKTVTLSIEGIFDYRGSIVYYRPSGYPSSNSGSIDYEPVFQGVNTTKYQSYRYRVAKQGVYPQDYYISSQYTSPSADVSYWENRSFPDRKGWPATAIDGTSPGLTKLTGPVYCPGPITIKRTSSSGYIETTCSGFIVCGTTDGKLKCYASYYTAQPYPGLETATYVLCSVAVPQPVAGFSFNPLTPDAGGSWQEINGTIGATVTYPFTYPNWENVYSNDVGYYYTSTPIYVNGVYYITSTHKGKTDIYSTPQLIGTTGATNFQPNWTRLNNVGLVLGLGACIIYVKDRFLVYGSGGVYTSKDCKYWARAKLPRRLGYFNAPNISTVVYNEVTNKVLVVTDSPFDVFSWSPP